MSTNHSNSPTDGQPENSYSFRGAQHIRDEVRGITLQERAVLYDANVRANGKRTFFIRFDTWAAALEVPESSLRRYVDSLVKKGFLKRQRRLKRCNEYTVLPNRSSMSGKKAPFSSPVSGTHSSPMSGTYSSPVSGLKTALTEDSLMEENSTSDAEASQGNEELLLQGHEKEKSGGGIGVLQLIARTDKANGIAAKFPTAGKDHEARWGLLCELTKQFHPGIAALLGTDAFQKLTRPLDRFAKGLAKEGQQEAVPRALAQFFAISTAFPELPAYASSYTPEYTAELVNHFVTKIKAGAANGSLQDDGLYRFRIDPHSGVDATVMEVQ